MWFIEKLGIKIMLSRRNIRIKVMQLLYAAGKDAQLNIGDLSRRYQSYGVKSLELYLFCLQQLVEVAQYSVKDEATRKAKLRPTEEDKRFTPRLFNNDLVQSLVKSETYQKLIKKHLISARIEEDNTRFLYLEFSKTDVYKQFLLDEQAPVLPVLLELFRTMYKSEDFNEVLEDHYPSWIDDESLIVGAIKKTLKGLPEHRDLLTEYGEEDKETLQFGDQLLMQTYKKDGLLLEDIKPMLQNWDSERVASIDMILLKMATCELTAFPTIPTKVTINEYVDVSKDYSTDKSKDFVNGILDRLMKKLGEEGRIVKEGRGLVD